MANENRSNPRVNKLTFITFVNKEEGVQKTPVFLGRTLNISKTGVGVEVFQQVAIGSTMEMEIGLTNEIFPASGKVVRMHELSGDSFFLGIEFDQVQEKLATVVLEQH
jgi:hypothetical protein